MLVFTKAYRNWGKRLLDLVLVILLLVILFPVIIIVAILVRVNLGAPIFFLQQRPGQYGQPFVMLKFRTMANTYDALGSFLPDVDRISSFGHFLRSASLDELPALLNVLKGEMSLIGPRPLLMRYLGRYTSEQMRRHEVKPGITGWAQVNGRNALSWEEKFALDVWYVDHQSFWLDMKILLLTIWKTLQREGINQPGQATVEEFMGTQT